MLGTGASTVAQTNPLDDCNTVGVYPFPVSAGEALTVQVRRVCGSAALFLAPLEIEVIDRSIRIGAQCLETVLPLFSCPVGQADLPALEPGDYAIEVYDLPSGLPLFDDELSVGRVAAIPTMNGLGLSLLALALAALGRWKIAGQLGRSRFSNRRS